MKNVIDKDKARRALVDWAEGCAYEAFAYRVKELGYKHDDTLKALYAVIAQKRELIKENSSLKEERDLFRPVAESIARLEDDDLFELMFAWGIAVPVEYKTIQKAMRVLEVCRTAEEYRQAKGAK